MMLEQLRIAQVKLYYCLLPRGLDMEQPQTNSTRRFSDRVEHYVRYRPNYPTGVLSILGKETGLTSASVIADIGSGTGISAELFLRQGNAVFGVEPNSEMRHSAEAQLRSYPKFHSVLGTAEQTTLPDQSVDVVLAAQAFHWFDRVKAKQEFARILKPGGWGVLIWNSRRTNSSPFLRDYEALLQHFGTDYCEIRHRNIEPQALQAFFSGGVYQYHCLDNEQRFDFAGLKGRLLSSSYTPNSTHPNFEPMLLELQRIFEQYQEHGVIRMEYDTELYFGHII